MPESSLFSELFAYSTLAMCIADSEGNVTEWNSAAESLFLIPRKQIIGRKVAELCPKDFEKSDKKYLSQIGDGQDIAFRTERIGGDGRTFPVNVALKHINNGTPDSVGLLHIFNLCPSNNQHADYRNHLSAIIGPSEEAIISKTLHGDILSWNNGAQKLFGYRAEEVIGKHISIIIPKERLDEENQIISRIQNGELFETFDTIRRRKDGIDIRVSLSVSPIFDFNGKIIGASKIARDISSKFELKRQQKIFTQELEDLNNHKDEFMVMASHELNTPLTVLKANLQVLEHLLEGDPKLAHVKNTIKQVDKLGNLVGDLLDVSKIQIGRLQLFKEKFNFYTVLYDTIKKLRKTTFEHKIILNSRAKVVPILADQRRIEQVLKNLFINAIKYSPGQDKIFIGMTLKDGKVLISVRDTGIGIPAHEIDNIFSRYYRVPELASTFTGSGIGLYITREIVHLHDGEMWVQSEIGHGSEFYITLPLAG